MTDGAGMRPFDNRVIDSRDGHALRDIPVGREERQAADIRRDLTIGGAEANDHVGGWLTVEDEAVTVGRAAFGDSGGAARLGQGHACHRRRRGETIAGVVADRSQRIACHVQEGSCAELDAVRRIRQQIGVGIQGQRVSTERCRAADIAGDVAATDREGFHGGARRDMAQGDGARAAKNHVLAEIEGQIGADGNPGRPINGAGMRTIQRGNHGVDGIVGRVGAGQRRIASRIAPGGADRDHVGCVLDIGHRDERGAVAGVSAGQARQRPVSRRHIGETEVAGRFAEPEIDRGAVACLEVAVAKVDLKHWALGVTRQRQRVASEVVLAAAVGERIG